MPDSQAQSNDGCAKFGPVARMWNAVEGESRSDGLEPGEWGEDNRGPSAGFARPVRSGAIVQARAIDEEESTPSIILADESVPRERAGVHLDGEEVIRRGYWGAWMEDAIAVGDAAGNGIQRAIRPRFVAAPSRDGLGMEKRRNWGCHGGRRQRVTCIGVRG